MYAPKRAEKKHGCGVHAMAAKSKGPRFQFEVQLPSESSRTSFNALIEEAKRLMTPSGHRRLDNYGLIMSLIDVAKQHALRPAQASDSHEMLPRQLPWLESSGKVSFYVHVAIVYK